MSCSGAATWYVGSSKPTSTIWVMLCNRYLHNHIISVIPYLLPLMWQYKFTQLQTALFWTSLQTYQTKKNYLKNKVSINTKSIYHLNQCNIQNCIQLSPYRHCYVITLVSPLYSLPENPRRADSRAPTGFGAPPSRDLHSKPSSNPSDCMLPVLLLPRFFI